MWQNETRVVQEAIDTIKNRWGFVYTYSAVILYLMLALNYSVRGECILIRKPGQETTQSIICYRWCLHSYNIEYKVFQKCNNLQYSVKLFLLQNDKYNMCKVITC